MTASEHIVAWIESSRPHYERLLKLSVPGNFRTDGLRALEAASLAIDAHREMTRGGDAYASDHDAGTILGAAVALVAWRLEE
jgi:hypothetical protein